MGEKTYTAIYNRVDGMEDMLARVAAVAQEAPQYTWTIRCTKETGSGKSRKTVVSHEAERTGAFEFIDATDTFVPNTDALLTYVGSTSEITFDSDFQTAYDAEL